MSHLDAELLSRDCARHGGVDVPDNDDQVRRLPHANLLEFHHDPGGLLRVLGELETAARLALPIVVLLLGAAGADLGAAARSVGMLAAEAVDAGTARRALADALAAARPTLLDLRAAA